MKTPHRKIKYRFFEKLAHNAIVFSGSTRSFIFAILVTFVWFITGPYFNYSDTWLLVINTGTTIVTFLMMFLIQRMQNKDSMALHLKLNEVIASMNKANNRLIDVEDLSEQELETLSDYYRKLAQMAKKEKSLIVSHSINEAIELHKKKI
jgi:low affinity Fe/Cu permease